MLLFNRPTRVLLPQIGREPIYNNNDDGYYASLKSKQEAYTKIIILTRTLHSFLQDLQ